MLGRVGPDKCCGVSGKYLLAMRRLWREVGQTNMSKAAEGLNWDVKRGVAKLVG